MKDNDKVFVIDSKGNYFLSIECLLDILRMNRDNLIRDGYTQANNYNNALIATFEGIFSEEKASQEGEASDVND